MGKESLLSRLQEFAGVTKNEATVALVIVLGLLIGVIVRTFGGGEQSKYNAALAKTVYQILDSIALAEKQSYTGIDDPSAPGSEVMNDVDTLNPLARYTNSAAKKKALPTRKVNISSATKAELIRLPGIGEAMAERIIAQRKSTPFTSANDLMQVKGIGKKKFEKLEPYIVAGK